MADRYHHGRLVLAGGALTLAFVAYFLTGHGHFFALCTLTVGLVGWLEGRTQGLIVATAVPLLAASAMVVKGVEPALIVRDNLAFWLICIVVGAGVGHLADVNRELRLANEEIRRLRSFLPICAECKAIRDDEGYWRSVEDYLAEHVEVQFSHGICPSCTERALREVRSGLTIVPDEGESRRQPPSWH